MISLKESKILSRGIFWFTALPSDGELDFSESEMIYLDVPYGTDNNIIGNSKDGNSFTHQRTWGELVINKSRWIRNKPWNYFPRGRVEILNEKAKVFFNPWLLEHMNFKKEIKNIFGLWSINIEFIPDNSSHYHCLVEDEI